jgi:hypothetical protein
MKKKDNRIEKRWSIFSFFKQKEPIPKVREKTKIKKLAEYSCSWRKKIKIEETYYQKLTQ